MYAITEKNHSESTNNVAGRIQTRKVIDFATSVTKSKALY